MDGNDWAERNNLPLYVVLNKYTHDQYFWFDLYIDGDWALWSVFWAIEAPAWSGEQGLCDWRLTRLTTHRHLNYHLCQIHKTHILAHYHPLTEARLARNPEAVLYSKCQTNLNSHVKLCGGGARWTALTNFCKSGFALFLMLDSQDHQF